MQPKQDEYYTVSPGENYYTDYENTNENQTYELPSNTGNSQVVDVAVMEQSQLQHQQQPPMQTQPQLQSIQQQPIPNYLQSDSEDSQIAYQNQPTNNAPQSQESDFDFSTNS